jgi:hypothetical protein
LLTYPTTAQAVRFCKHLTIQHQETLKTVPFVPNRDQIEILDGVLRRAHSHRKDLKAIILKSRQIGSTTILCALFALICILNPGIESVIAANKGRISKRTLGLIRSFIKQAGMTLQRDGSESIVLDGGTSLHAITTVGAASGQESDAARSFSPALLYVTEAAYIRNDLAINALLNSTMGCVILESTAQGADNRFAQIYMGAADSDWERIFAPFETHEAYRAPADTLTDGQWDDLQREWGFTNRAAAAWWFRKLQNDGKGLQSHLRDYPIKWEHAFQTVGGAFIDTLPKVLPYREHGQFGLRVYHEPRPECYYYAALDPGYGRGKDRTGYAILRADTGQLVASFASSEHDIDWVIRGIQETYSLFSPQFIIVETNGGGGKVYDDMTFMGLPVERHHTGSGADKFNLLLPVKRAIENGSIAGCEWLREDVASCRRNEKGVFIGRDDLLMAIAFALHRINRSPITPDVSRDENRVWYDKFLKRGPNIWM